MRAKTWFSLFYVSFNDQFNGNVQIAENQNLRSSISRNKRCGIKCQYSIQLGDAKCIFLKRKLSITKNFSLDQLTRLACVRKEERGKGEEAPGWSAMIEALQDATPNQILHHQKEIFLPFVSSLFNRHFHSFCNGASTTSKIHTIMIPFSKQKWAPLNSLRHFAESFISIFFLGGWKNYVSPFLKWHHFVQGCLFFFNFQLYPWS